MKEITTHKLNESYSVIDGPPDTLREIFDFLKVERPDAYMDKLVQSGFKSPYDYFASIQHKKLLVMNGHIQFLGKFGVPQLPDSESDYTIDEIDAFIDDIKKIIPFEPYDFQITAFKDSILNKKQINKMCTSSGKSVTISMLCEFMRRQGKKGLLLVPNINLLTQFKDDISSYNLTELFDNTHLIGGGNKERHFDNSLTISTWQSLQERFGHNLDLSEIDYVINDECLDPETLITTDGGLVKISDIKAGDLVLTLNEENGKHEFKPVVKLHKNLGISRNEKMYKINMEDGTHIKITGNHKVNTARGWVRADELTLDDDIISL